MSDAETRPNDPAAVADLCLAAAEGNARQAAHMAQGADDALAADVADVLTRVALSQAISAVVFQLRTPPTADELAARFAAALMTPAPEAAGGELSCNLMYDPETTARYAYRWADALVAERAGRAARAAAAIDARAEQNRRPAGRPELSP